MAISSIHETLLMYTKKKSLINDKLSDIMFDMMSATRKTAELQQAYNNKQQELYFDETYGYGTDMYMELIESLDMDHEFELATIESWESELELEKNNYETQLNEITSYETSWTKLLQTNIKNDFSYGSVGQ